MRTIWPFVMNGDSSTAALALSKVLRALISSSLSGRASLPAPKICRTPGVLKIGTRIFGSNWQNTYPGNMGSSTCFRRSHHFRNVTVNGRHVAIPFALSNVDTNFSCRDCTYKTNQLSESKGSTSTAGNLGNISKHFSFDVGCISHL